MSEGPIAGREAALTVKGLPYEMQDKPDECCSWEGMETNTGAGFIPALCVFVADSEGT